MHKDNKRREITFDPCNQYTIQSDLFSNAILNDQDPPTSLEDGVMNMKVIDAIFLGAESGMFVKL